MERTLVLFDDNEIDLEDIDFTWTPSSVQATFKQHAEKVRNAALAVREYSQSFAELAVNRTEDVRSATIDVLDEFSEVALQEIGRKMVADNNGDSSSPSSDQRNAKWSDWKEFRLLKEHLIQTRQDLIDFDIPMEDINIVLRQAQETANILAKEAAQYLSSLKARADNALIYKNKKEHERRKIQEEVEEEELGDDIEIYEDLEDDESSENSSINTDALASEATPDVPKASDELDKETESLKEPQEKDKTSEENDEEFEDEEEEEDEDDEEDV